MGALFRRLRAPVIDAPLWHELCAQTPWFAGLDDLRRWHLRALSERFLHEKTITPLEGLSLDGRDCVQLAALCCLPLIDLGPSAWRGWSQLIVYPDAFRVHRSRVDFAGVVHEWEDELAGEAWEAGPLILSWTDVQADLQEPDAGYCVVAHEIAHKIDALDGEMDGTPPLFGPWRRLWARDFGHAYDLLCQQVDAGEEPAIDAYATEGPDEFFAVATEYHFSAPKRLRQAMPEVAAHLRRFYGPPPTF